MYCKFGVFLEEKSKNRLMLFLGSLFVAVIFLTAYASFGNNNIDTGTNSTTTTVVNTQAFFGQANAVVNSYGPAAEIQINTKNATIKGIVGNVLDNYSSKGLISDYQIGNNYNVEFLSNLSAYTLQQKLFNETSSNSLVSVNTTTYVTLPQRITVTRSGYTPISAYVSQTNQSLVVEPLLGVGQNVRVSVIAGVTPNSTIPVGQLEVKPVS